MLHGQVQVADQFRHVFVGVDQVLVELHRVGGGVTNAVNTVNGGDIGDQGGHVDNVTFMAQAPVGVDVLAQQVDLAHALVGQVYGFGQDIVQRTADFLATRVRYDTKRAVLAAAFLDSEKGLGFGDFGLRQAVEFLDFGKADIHNGAALAGGIQHFRQPVQGLRAKYHVNIGRALANHVAFLAGHAAANGDFQVRFVVLELTPAAQLVKHLLLGLFPYGTSI